MIKIFNFYILISLILFSSGLKKFRVLEEWDQYSIMDDGNDYTCNECTASKLKVSPNNTISMCLARIYNYEIISENDIKATFGILRTEIDTEHYWIAFPGENVVAKNREDYLEFRIFSVMGFDIDDKENYYLLDQGIILQNNNTIMENTSKLVIFSQYGEKKKVYYFNYSDFTTSFLTDIVVDQDKKYAYITDSGNLLNNQSIPRLIVIDLKKDKIYRILKNNTEFEPDENLEIIYSPDNELANYFTNVTGLNNIQITCDGKMIYFTSSKNSKLYKVLTKDIKNGIKKYEDLKDEKYLNNIKLESINKGIISQSFLISSKNNIFMGNGENGAVRILYSLDDNLKKFNFDDYKEINSEKFVINSPGSISVSGGKLYVLDNHLYDRNISQDNNTSNETVKKYVIYYTNLLADEISSIEGCTIYSFNLSIISAFIGGIFIMVIIIAIFLMILNREKSMNNLNNDKKNENEENVNELNRRLNE